MKDFFVRSYIAVYLLLVLTDIHLIWVKKNAVEHLRHVHIETKSLDIGPCGYSIANKQKLEEGIGVLSFCGFCVLLGGGFEV